jgi:sodium transport system ATP-binding protein
MQIRGGLAVIQVRQVTKRFDAVTAVSNLSFDAANRAITGLLGANGAGKTTTLRLIAGVLSPDQGGIHVGGESSPTNAVAVQEHLGALLDHTGLYGRLTARENIEYFAELRGIPRATRGERVDALLADLGLTGIAGRAVAGFSQGERMKVALARALIHRPSHLLLDEPTNGLDVSTQRTLRGLLKTLRDSGTCVVFSSHVLGDVEDLCNRIVVIAKGSVVGEGTTEELCRATATTTLEGAFLKLTENAERSPC